MAVYALAILAISMTLVASTLFGSAYGQLDSPTIILQSSFVDSEGRVNVVGTVRNYDQNPVQVTVGLATEDGSAIEAEPYGRVIWPLTDSPFKFVLDDKHGKAGIPYVKYVKEMNLVRYDTLVLTYDGMAVGPERAFVGKIKNTGPFEVRNVSVYAAVHSPDHTSQLDSVRSNVISVIKPGEELDFVAVPDATIRANVLYYSCAGIDYDDPITTVKVGDGKVLAYNLEAAAQVRNFRYENSSDSLAFGIRPYSPNGGDLSIMIPQVSSNQTVTVFIDGESHDALVSGDGRTMNIDFFVPKGEHEVQIQGVRNVPEFPYSVIALVGALAAFAWLRLARAAFKMS